MNKSILNELLTEHNITARKKLSMNTLIKEGMLLELADELGYEKVDKLLEGAGAASMAKHVAGREGLVRDIVNLQKLTKYTVSKFSPTELRKMSLYDLDQLFNKLRTASTSFTGRLVNLWKGGIESHAAAKTAYDAARQAESLRAGEAAVRAKYNVLSTIKQFHDKYPNVKIIKLRDAELLPTDQLASYADNLKRVGGVLDTYPNLNIPNMANPGTAETIADQVVKVGDVAASKTQSLASPAVSRSLLQQVKQHFDALPTSAKIALGAATTVLIAAGSVYGARAIIRRIKAARSKKEVERIGAMVKSKAAANKKKKTVIR